MGGLKGLCDESNYYPQIQKDLDRVKFRTNVSQSYLNELKEMALEQNTYVNHLIEFGLKEVLNEKVIEIPENTKPKDRVQYKSTYDK